MPPRRNIPDSEVHLMTLVNMSQIAELDSLVMEVGANLKSSVAMARDSVAGMSRWWGEAALPTVKLRNVGNWPLNETFVFQEYGVPGLVGRKVECLVRKKTLERILLMHIGGVRVAEKCGKLQLGRPQGALTKVARTLSHKLQNLDYTPTTSDYSRLPPTIVDYLLTI
ncbi:hypothetical protein F5887DRAFT_924113 [Amanita rubescens]|nr:hypothetical protein F5887DRAFT_924113 [Amanita rubescens]